MNFILKMAWRDTRASRRRLLLFSLAIVLGVAALVAIGSLRDNLRSANRDRGTTLVLVTHDLELARQTQRVLRLRSGAVISDDRPST